jgi:hypothetical protein
MEVAAQELLARPLEPLEVLVRYAYEAAVEAPTIPSGVHVSGSSTAALFLKRALVDLRAVWVLLRSGYTSPAAAVAASLWEHSLAVAAILSDPQAHRSIAKNGDIPWSAIDLAEFLREDAGDTRPANAYAAYKWLCKIKHPTLRSAVHDAGAAAVADGTYAVMSAPDTRVEDLASKRTIVMLCLARVTHAAETFVEANKPDRQSPAYQRFASLISRTTSGASEQMGKDPLPFHLQIEDMPKRLVPRLA